MNTPYYASVSTGYRVVYATPVTLEYRVPDVIRKVNFRSRSWTGLLAGITTLYWNRNTVCHITVTIQCWTGLVDRNATGPM